jgi:hypothetical protein
MGYPNAEYDSLPHAVVVVVHYSKLALAASALGQKQTLRRVSPMSALPPRADVKLVDCGEIDGR